MDSWKGKGRGQARIRYDPVSQDTTDDDDDEEDIYNFIDVKKGSKHVTFEMTTMTGHQPKKHKHNDQDVNIIEGGTISKTRKCCYMLSLLTCVAIALLLAFLYPWKHKQGVTTMNKTRDEINSWENVIDDYGSESAIHIEDINKDGVGDVILGIGYGRDTIHINTPDEVQKFCKLQGMHFPCLGKIICLSGTDGKELWHLDTYSAIYYSNCNIDIDRDGSRDCIAAGRRGTIVAFTTSGKLLWTGRTIPRGPLNTAWNIYMPLVLIDFDGDLVPEIVVSHGGNPKFKPKNHAREAGLLMLLSGATGKMIGRPLRMPDSKETYMAPVLHTCPDGSQYILFGSGGETVPGSLMAIGVPHFYHYVMSLPSSKPVMHAHGNYEWYKLHKLTTMDGILTLYRSSTKGVMVPPVLVDITSDGTADIMVSLFDGTTLLLNGMTLTQIWKKDLIGYESYSTPAPGYFNNDSTLDFMSHWSYGFWPKYNHSKVIIQDGKTGQILWSYETSMMVMSSDLVVKTTTNHRDAFIFRVQGRIHGEAKGGIILHDIQHQDGQNITKRFSDEYQDSKQTPSGKWSDIKKYLLNRWRNTGNSEQDYENRDNKRKRIKPTPKLDQDDSRLQNDILPKHVRKGKDSLWRKSSSGNVTPPYKSINGQEDTIKRDKQVAPSIWSCDSDNALYISEVFIVDRTTAHRPIRLMSSMAEEFHYNMSYAADLSLEGKEYYASRGENISDARCTHLIPAGRTTGAVGNGYNSDLDLYMIFGKAGQMRDSHDGYVSMKYKTYIKKINLQQKILTGPQIQISSVVSNSVTDNEPAIENITLKAYQKQNWIEYMGKDGTSNLDRPNMID